jgi:hypothetical protein
MKDIKFTPSTVWPVHMNFYVLEKLGKLDYNEYTSFLVVAGSEKEARQLASKEVLSASIWLDPKLSSCELVTLEDCDIPQVVMSHYIQVD